MVNSFYNVSGTPGTGTFAASQPIRSEYTAIAAGFDKLPTLSAGTASKPVVVNPGGTALTTTTGTLALAGNFATTGAFATTLVAGADVSLTLPVVSGTLATLAGTETLSNKTLVGVALGTPVSGIATNLTGIASGLTAGTVTTNANLTGGVTSVGNAATVVTNANLTGVITSIGNATSIGSQTGTGVKFVVDNGPTLIAPVLGAATATSINKVAITAPASSATLTIADGKTLTASNTLTFTGTDSSSVAFGAGGTVLYANQSITLSGDVSGSGTTAISTTLATVNGNVGTFGSATQAVQLTVNGKGLVTAAANVTVTPAVGSITGLGTGVATALAVNVGSAGAPVVLNGAGGTPSSIVLTNATGTASGLTAGTASAVAASAITGTTLASGVTASSLTSFGSSPTLVTPLLGIPTSGTLTNCTGLPAASVIAGALANGMTATTQALGDNGTKVATTAFVNQILRSYLAGLTLSAAGSTATFGVAAGVATDGTNVSVMALASAYTKTTSAWAVGSGNGSLDTGAIAINTWYHVWLIQRVDTGVVDVLVSLSASAPTMPTNYTLKRRIGAMKTDGSSQWVAFSQNGDEFLWAAPVADISATDPGIAAVTRTLASVPTGVIVNALFVGLLVNADVSNVAYFYFSSLATNDVAPSGGGAFFDNATTITAASGVTGSAVRYDLRTNLSAQVRSRLSFSNASVGLTVNTLGWIDPRGRAA